MWLGQLGLSYKKGPFFPEAGSRYPPLSPQLPLQKTVLVTLFFLSIRISSDATVNESFALKKRMVRNGNGV